MNTFKINLKYKGSNYFGWQIQSGSKLPTIQGHLNRALDKITNGRENAYLTIGSGRTDAGVHAFNQIAKLSLDFLISTEKLTKALNSLLPCDIKIQGIDICHENFHPIFCAKSKEYRYYFSTKSYDPFMSDRVYFLDKKLDVEKMQEACEILMGEHDFINYFCTGTPVKSTVRTIYSAEIIENVNALDSDYEYSFHVIGNGFLKQMVRLLIGALFNIGLGKVSLPEFKESLSHKLKNKLSAVSPPQGLHLYKVNY